MPVTFHDKGKEIGADQTIPAGPAGPVAPVAPIGPGVPATP
ncbi:hypothetical protein QUB11_30850 [Microcoleus sp. B6-A1]